MFIELTQTSTNEKILVNTDNIAIIEQTSGSGCYIVFNSLGNPHEVLSRYVTESFDGIQKLMTKRLH